MDRKLCIIATDPLRLGGMVAALKDIAGGLVIVTVGSHELAEAAAAFGPLEVHAFYLDEGVPAEAVADSVASLIAVASPDVTLCGESAAARVTAGMLAGKIGAAVVSNVVGLADQGDAVVVTREVATGKALEEDLVAGKLVGIYVGPDADSTADAPSAIGERPAESDGDVIVGYGEAGGAGLANALRIIGVGMGITSQADLAITDALAEVLGAEIACTLPACDNMHWYTPDRVLGSSHNSAAPELYISVGISGSPNHTSGFRDAKVVASINSDEKAEIFAHSKYGIVGDLYKVVPALTKALS